MYPIILIGGFGRSGTGAIHQLLRAHDEIYALPHYEFRLLTDPDGLLSLKSAIVDNWNIFQADFAIDRFIKLYNNLGNNLLGPYVGSNFKKHFDESYLFAIDLFLKDLGVIKYNGLWAGKSNLLKKVILKLSNHNKKYIGNPMIRYCANKSSHTFFEATQSFVQNIHHNCMEKNNKSIILLNEPNSTQSPENCMNLSGSKKMLVVCRDPRDSFASFISKDWTPNKINDSITFFKSVYTRWLKEKEKINDENIFEVKLEMLVKDPEAVIKNISDFIEIDITLKQLDNSKYSAENAHVGRWENDFTIYEKNIINTEFKEILNYYNYH
jgi:hypothetical protein